MKKLDIFEKGLKG